MLGVLVINSTCKDKRNSGNHDITKKIRLLFIYSRSPCFVAAAHRVSLDVSLASFFLRLQ